MKNAPMRFDNMSLHHNPRLLRIENENRLSILSSPCAAPDSRLLNRKPMVVSAEGELYGADCIEQYRSLEKRHFSQKRAKLVLPHMTPIYAYLKELRLLAEPVENVLTYRFVFVEAQSPRTKAPSAAYYVTEAAGESLWDISVRCQTGIDELVRLNPQIADIDELKAGERVRVC